MDFSHDAMERRKKKGLAITITVSPSHPANEAERREQEHGSDLAPNPIEEGEEHDEHDAPMLNQHPGASEEPGHTGEVPIHEMLSDTAMHKKGVARVLAAKKGQRK